MTTPLPVTRVDSLLLENFRSFAGLKIDFHENLTVLTAPNGGGKTAVLDALAVAWMPFLSTMESRAQSPGFSHADIRRVISPDRTMEPVLPTSFMATGMVDGRRTVWSRELASDRPHARTTRMEAAELFKVAEHLRLEVQEYAQEKRPSPPTLPVFCYYGTGRLWGATRRTGRRSSASTSRTSGYADALSSASRFVHFVDWFERYSREAQHEVQTHRESPHNPRARLGIIRKAVGRLLRPSRWAGLDWDFALETLAAVHPELGRLPVENLSDGVRTMIGLGGDLAHRIARLNPHLGDDAASLTPGVVLVDEVDMHLHPVWQQVVLDGLREAFPAVQFIVTTHSPQVLSTVAKESIRILRLSDGKGTAEQPPEQTRGTESADVLATVMGASPRPPVEEARLLEEYHAKIQAGELDAPEILEVRRRLEEHFGAAHALIRDCDRVIRLETMKRKLLAKRDSPLE